MYAALVIVLATWALVGCFTKTSLQAPVTGVVRLLGELSAKSLPGGPLKSFDCFAVIDQAELVGGWHGTETVIVKVRGLPDAMFRLRSLIDPPEKELPVGAFDTSVTVKPAGAVTFADPSDCGLVWLAMVRATVAVEPPASVGGVTGCTQGPVAQMFAV